MNNVSKKSHLLSKGAGTIVLALVALGTAWSQDSTVTTIQHGPSSYDTQVKNAEVVYAEGNDLVLKLETGRVEHMVVPDSDRFTVDGKEVSAQELVPGTKLTQTITTTTTPRYVNSVRTIEGKVWHVNAPKSVILSLPDNTNQVFNVPDHAKFTIDGRERTVFDLKKGMKIKATVVTDDEHTVIEQSKFAFGKAPAPATPREVGVLLFLAPSHPYPTLASAEQPADMLPETGTSLPLIGLLGTLAIAMSLGLWAVRRTRTI
jgi:LPXTG-motif cell wall-anchored protein